MELFNFGSLLIQAINLAIVVYVLHRFLFKPYLTFIDKEYRERELLNERLKESEVILTKAEEKAFSIVENAKKEAKKVREEARVFAKQEASLITFEANKEADALRLKALSEIDSERKSMETSMKERILSIALKLNEKLFVNPKANEALLEKFSKDL